MDMKEQDRQALRTGIERLVRLAPLTAVAILDRWPASEGSYEIAVHGFSSTVEPPPLDATRQLALSVLLGEPVPTPVLLSAMEDAGMFPRGVFEAVADEREKIKFPVAEYLKEGDGFMACYHRRTSIMYPARRRLMTEVADLCLSALGRKEPVITKQVKKFVETWVAPRELVTQADGHQMYLSPAPDFMRRQVQNMPSLRRILAHLRPRATAATGKKIDRLLKHLDSVPARSDLG